MQSKVGDEGDGASDISEEDDDEEEESLLTEEDPIEPDSLGDKGAKIKSSVDPGARGKTQRAGGTKPLAKTTKEDKEVKSDKEVPAK